MRREPATEESIAEARMLAREEPGTGLPTLARRLLECGWRIDRERPSARIPYFEEAAAIYRDLLTNGSDEHLAPQRMRSPRSACSTPPRTPMIVPWPPKPRQLNLPGG
ncbi:hypothetical protein [Streptomyces anulatus]|uniref:hypothetical protein n=1 Tax=Streptomyces anulatus TaxID=1892 RepID=UPI003664B61D